jgi:hypothetical protein
VQADSIGWIIPTAATASKAASFVVRRWRVDRRIEIWRREFGSDAASTHDSRKGSDGAAIEFWGRGKRTEFKAASFVGGRCSRGAEQF